MPEDTVFTSIPENETITRQALGRIAMLGDLYDAHTDCFCGLGLFTNNLPSNSINLTDTKGTNCEYIFKDTMSGKLHDLKVEAELKASFMSGLVAVSGHGMYLSSNSSTNRETSATLVCKMTTKHEAIKFNNANVIRLISPDSVRSTPNATHVVTAIQWGAVATVTLKCSNEEGEDKTEIEGALKAELACIKIGAAGAGRVNDHSTSRSRHFQLEFYIDALPDGNIPQTVEEAVEFMARLPALVANANGGKGVRISFTLLPLSTLKHYLGSIDSINKIIRSISEDAIEKAIHVFDEISQSYRKLNDIHSDFQKNSFCISKEDVDRVFEYITILQSSQKNLKQQMHNAILEIRKGNADVRVLYDKINDYHKQPANRKNIDQFIHSLMPLREKIDFAAHLIKKGVNYIGYGKSLYSATLEKEAKGYYIFFCSWNTKKGFGDNKQYFNSLVDQNELPCFLADIYVQPDIGKREGVPDGNRICLYCNGKYISYDCYAEYLKDKDICLVKCTQKRVASVNKSNKRVDVEIICPQSMNGGYCQRLEREWICAVCRERLQYDFNYNFLCDCGSASINTFQFRCCDDKHGSDYVSFDEDYLKSLADTIRPYRENPLLPDFITGLNVQQQTLIKSVWNSDTLTLSEKIARIDLLEDKMEEGTRREYRRWRFEHDKSSVNAFLEKQKPAMQNIIRSCLSTQSNLDEFYNSMLALLSSFNDRKAFLNWAKSEMLQWDILFYMAYGEKPNYEGRICLFNSITFEVEIVEKFSTWANPCRVATGNDKIFLIDGEEKVFEIFNYETKQLTKGPNPPEWRSLATVAYYKNKLYYIGGLRFILFSSSCVNILVNGEWQRGPDFPIGVMYASQVICNDKLYIISANAVFQLSDNEREWIEVGKMNGNRSDPAVASLNGKIYITGGCKGFNALNSCLCFDSSQPFDKRFTSIANMHYKRGDHSLVVANGKLYAIGGLENVFGTFCKSIEEYDPVTDSWLFIGRI